jgi:hypothetical protein
MISPFDLIYVDYVYDMLVYLPSSYLVCVLV